MFDLARFHEEADRNVGDNGDRQKLHEVGEGHFQKEKKEKEQRERICAGHLFHW